MFKKHVLRLGVRSDRVDPPPPPPISDPPPPPQPPDENDEVARARYEADAAKASESRLRKELEDIRRQLPSQADRERYAQLELEAQNAEEGRKRKEGEFDSWRTQIESKHAKELAAERDLTAHAQTLSVSTEKELNDTLIGLAFSGATDWFGPNGKTVLLPEIAQSYFQNHVFVEVIPGVHGAASKRRVVVRGMNGSNIVDLKTGQPLAFDQAIGELVEAHPRRAWILKGSGKVGSNSAGGDNGIDGKDLRNLKPADFKDPKVRDAVREKLSAPGGLQIGPGFDQQRRRS